MTIKFDLQNFFKLYQSVKNFAHTLRGFQFSMPFNTLIGILRN